MQERAAARSNKAGSRFPFPSYSRPPHPYDRQFKPSGTPDLFLSAASLPEPVGANVATALKRGEQTESGKRADKWMNERASCSMRIARC